MSDFNYDDLMYALHHNKDFDKFRVDNQKQVNDNIESFNTIVKEAFSSGFESGKEAGFTKGVINTNIKMLIKLVKYTNLIDEDILKVLDKEGESIYINKLDELRNDG